jgi:hypothetical protein
MLINGFTSVDRFIENKDCLRAKTYYGIHFLLFRIQDHPSGFQDLWALFCSYYVFYYLTTHFNM